MAFGDRGVRALVTLHERELRAFASAWREARAKGVALPATDDPDYESMETLLHHILRASRGYLTWICEVLGRPDPGVPPAPEADAVEAEANSYIHNLCEAWRTHMAWMPREVADSPASYLSRWKHPYTIDAMLEHAVVHPMRHRFQLEELIGAPARF